MNGHLQHPKFLNIVAFCFVATLIPGISFPKYSNADEQSIVAKTGGGVTESLPMPGIKLDQLAEGLQALLAEARANHPILDGVWVDVELDLEKRDAKQEVVYVFRRLLDITHATEQRELTNEVFKKLLPENNFRVDLVNEKLVPYSELKSQLEELLVEDVRFEECTYRAAEFSMNSDSGSFNFAPFLGVVRPLQFDEFIKECNRIFYKSPEVWSDFNVRDLDPEQMIIVPGLFEPDVNEVFAEIRTAFKNTAGLRGAWLDVEIDNQGYPDIAPKIYCFKRILSDQNSSVQVKLIESLVKRLIKSGRYRIEQQNDLVVPFEALVSRLKSEIDISPEYRGCWIQDAMFTWQENSDLPVLELKGRVWKAEQAVKIFNLCDKVMAQSARWRDSGLTLERDPQGLAVLYGSEADELVYYCYALESFWKRDYQQADYYFALANLEDPQNYLYGYWRVIAEIASNETSLAEKRLQLLTDYYHIVKGSREYSKVLKEIWRIQGPLRAALLESEKRVFMERAFSARTAF